MTKSSGEVDLPVRYVYYLTVNTIYYLLSDGHRTFPPQTDSGRYVAVGILVYRGKRPREKNTII